MTTEEIKSLITNIEQEITSIDQFAGIIDPALQGPIIVGNALLSQVPALATLVSGLIQGNPLSDGEKNQKANELAVLSDPNRPS